MAEKRGEKQKFFREMIYFPIVYNVEGLVAVSVLYAFSPEHFVDSETLNAVLYLGVVATHWFLFYILVRRLGKNYMKELIVPKKKFRFLPSILVFLSLNVIFTGYMVLALTYGRIPPFGHVTSLQFIFYILINPLTAGFVEELIWRGYFIENLLRAGKAEWKAIIYSSTSFAFIHGFIIVDKLIVTFLFGVIAGAYYLRERNIPVLMATHMIVDVIAFSMTIFKPF